MISLLLLRFTTPFSNISVTHPASKGLVQISQQYGGALSSEFSNFQWLVAGPHRWVIGKRAADDFEPMSDPREAADALTEQRYLVGRAFQIGAKILTYNPLRTERGLFRTFSALDPSEEGIRDFADKYGLLGGYCTVQIVLDGVENEGESFYTWRQEILSMRYALALWDMAKDGNQRGLQRHIRWNKGVISHHSHPDLNPDELPPHFEWGWIAAEAGQPEIFRRFRKGDVIQPAKHLVQRRINQHLAGSVNYRLLWDPTWTQQDLYAVPISLIAAMWMQFGHAISGDKAYRKCDECDKWFELSAEDARMSRLHCSPACRSRAYRKRVLAKQLHENGLSVTVIAQRVGKNVETVDKWLSTAKEAKN